jgi:hypothetical protein
MASVVVISGYVEIPDHPRGPHDYRALGQQLEAAVEAAGVPMVVADHQKVEDTWLARYLNKPANITHSIADNPEKNTLAYHCVQHEKFVWIAQASEAEPADVIVWVDYGILHVSGITAAVIQKYLQCAGDYGSAVTLPGCWPRTDLIAPNFPCWRFCGGLIAVPRPLVKTFTRGATATAIRHIETTRNVEWEVNTLARFEQTGLVPMSWYRADHDATMFSAAP